MAKIQVFPTRIRNGQACRCHMGPAREYLRQNFGNARDRLDNQGHAQFVGERLYEIEFRTGWSVRADRIGCWAVARNHTKLARLENLIQNGRGARAGADQCSGSGRIKRHAPQICPRVSYGEDSVALDE